MLEERCELVLFLLLPLRRENRLVWNLARLVLGTKCKVAQEEGQGLAGQHALAEVGWKQRGRQPGGRLQYSSNHLRLQLLIQSLAVGNQEKEHVDPEVGRELYQARPNQLHSVRPVQLGEEALLVMMLLLLMLLPLAS